MSRAHAPGARSPARGPTGRFCAVIAAAYCLSGCLILRSGMQAGEPFPREEIRGIVRGETTREQVVARLGPPAAVARQGGTTVLPCPGPTPRGRQDVRPEAFFELFSARRVLRPAEIVFYYNAPRVEETGFIFFPIVGGGHIDRHIVLERLWLLIDESRGTVEDYVFRGAE